MIDMTSTFPYFLVKNEKQAEEVPSIIVPSEDGTYYKVGFRLFIFFANKTQNGHKIQ